MNDLIGQSLGRYHILEQLGEGGMAIVYKAYDTRLERDVAVKVIRTEKLTIETMGKTLKRFEREAKALAKLTHPNIVPITDYGEHDEKPYLVMPYLPGGTLKQKLGKPIPWEDSVRLLIPIARALHYAHQQGVIHRDVKPANILITQSGEPMLTDFGIAKILLDTEETADLTGTGMGVGTPEYMSPEQFQGKGVDARTDVYSLGVVLYEMVTGRKPYQADTPAAVLIKQVTEALPRPRSFVSELPDAVERILLKALAKEKENRYESMAELANVSEGLLSLPPIAKEERENTTEKAHISQKPLPVTQQEESRARIAQKTALRSPLPIAKMDLRNDQTKKSHLPQKRKIWVWALVIIVGILGISLAISSLIGIREQQRARDLEQITATNNITTIQPTATKRIQIDSIVTAITIATSTAKTRVISPQNATQITNLLTLTRNDSGWRQSVIFSPDGSTLASSWWGSDSNTKVSIWNTSDGTLLRTLEDSTYAYPYGVYDIAFNPDGKILATTSGLNVYLWQVSDGTLIRQATKPSGVSKKPFESVKFSPNGNILAIVSGQLIYLWRVSDSSFIETLGGNIGEIDNIAFSPDGQTLVSKSWANNSNIWFWDVTTGSLLKSLKMDVNNITMVAFSPDLLTLASGSYKDNSIRLWRASDGTLIHTWQGHMERISSLAFSPSGLIVASASDDGEIRLWDSSDGLFLHALEGHTDSVQSLAFSPDGLMIASASEDGTIRLWGIAP